MTDEKLTDLWRTPPELFHAAEKFFNLKFTYDWCADESNHLCDRYRKIGRADYYNDTDIAWCNPPYSKPLPHIEVMSSAFTRSVALVKSDASTQAFKFYYEHAAGIYLMNFRIRFNKPDGTPAPQGADFPTMLVYFSQHKVRNKPAQIHLLTKEEFYK